MDNLNIAKNTHVLIAGTTGAGKSYYMNYLLDGIIKNGYVILIDPKGCEYIRYKKHKHCIYYASDPNKIIYALNLACKYMDHRFKEMSKKSINQSTRSHIYIFIDEYIDIKMLSGKKAEDPLKRLLSKARASNIHVFLGTQRCTNDVIHPIMRACFTAFIGLRTATSQESKNIIGISGCEKLPLYGYGYYKSPYNKDIVLIRT